MSELTGRVGTLDPYQITARMSTPSSYRRANFPAYLWDAKAFPFFAIPFCRIRKSVPLIVIVQLLPTSWAPSLLSKTICV